LSLDFFVTFCVKAKSNDKIGFYFEALVSVCSPRKFSEQTRNLTPQPIYHNLLCTTHNLVYTLLHYPYIIANASYITAIQSYTATIASYITEIQSYINTITAYINTIQSYITAICIKTFAA
jgi:hypothetical protein